MLASPRNYSSLLYSTNFGQSFGSFGQKSHWGALSTSLNGQITVAADSLDPGAVFTFLLCNNRFELRYHNRLPAGSVTQVAISSEGNRIFAITPREPVWIDSSVNFNSSANCSTQALHASGGSQGFSQKGVVLLTLSFVGIGLLLVSITYYYIRGKGLLVMFKCWTISPGARPLPVG